MARPLRIQYPGAFYHVTSHGNEQKDIVRNKTDRLKFLSYLESASVRYGAVVHAYCLMDNHYHLLLETPLGNLSRIMGHINGAYTTYFNVKRKRSGHLFQGRYKSILIEADAYALELSSYIHLNPVRAGIVVRPEEFSWSSYCAYIGKVTPPDWLKTDLVSKLATSNLGRDSREYCDFVERHLGQDVINPLEATVGATLLGSDSFIDQVTEQHLSREQRESGRAAVLPCNWFPPTDLIIDTVDAAFGEDVNACRRAAIYLCQKLSGKTLREIGDRFGLGESGVSQSCRRYADTLAQDPLLERKLKRVKNVLREAGSENGLRRELPEGEGTKRETKGVRRERSGVGDRQLLEQKIVEVLEVFPQVLFSTLFGSAARDRMTDSSDIDIAVAAPEPLSVETRAGLAMELSGALGREVDLVDCQAVSGLILEQALCSGIIVKNDDHDLYARLLKRLWYNQADMMPYCRRILEQRSSQWLQQ